MAGGNPEKGLSNTNNNNKKPSSSSSHPESTTKLKPKHKPSPNPIPRPDPPPPPPPAYGFHMLDRRTIVLADGTARSYFALPPDYHQQTQIQIQIRPQSSSWLGFPDDHHYQDYSRKRKLLAGDEAAADEFARQRQQLLQYGNGAGPSAVHKHMRMTQVDEAKLKTAFLKFLREIIENANQKKKYLADGKQGPLHCLACNRSSKDFPDVHSLVMHAYNPEKSTSDQVADHLGLHKALCFLMGWNYLMPPDNSKVYQRLSAEEIAADRDDLIMWPPHVIIHNTITGKGKEGRMEGLGNKAMDMKLRDFGFSTGKSKSMFGRDGHMGRTVVKFAGDQSGLKDAMRLADFFEKQKHGREHWASVQSMYRPGSDDPSFAKLDKKTGEKERILYGHLGTVFDLEIVDYDTRKKVNIESKREKAHHT